MGSTPCHDNPGNAAADAYETQQSAQLEQSESDDIVPKLKSSP